jgi:hypothetical protein
MPLYKIDVTDTHPDYIKHPTAVIKRAQGNIIRNGQKIGIIYYNVEQILQDDVIVIFDKDEQGQNFYKDAVKAYNKRKHDDDLIAQADYYTVWYARFLLFKYLKKSLTYRKFDSLISGRGAGIHFVEE